MKLKWIIQLYQEPFNTKLRNFLTVRIVGSEWCSEGRSVDREGREQCKSKGSGVWIEAEQSQGNQDKYGALSNLKITNTGIEQERER